MNQKLMGLLAGLVISQTALAGLGPEYREVAKIPHVAVDLRYASTNNFMGEDLYGDFRTAYLHSVAYKKLERAAAALNRVKPGWKFLVYDALRPRSVQWKLWNRVKGTDKEEYVADPARGSIHNFGFAIDLTLQDEGGREVDMGTEFDHFSELAHPEFEDRLVREGRLKREQVENRKVLRTVLEGAGFKNIKNEWWHFDALAPAIVRSKYKIVE